MCVESIIISSLSLALIKQARNSLGNGLLSSIQFVLIIEIANKCTEDGCAAQHTPNDERKRDRELSSVRLHLYMCFILKRDKE